MTKKLGRNEPCPCGSGKKYKKCCLKNKKPATVERASKISTWDYVTRWVTTHKGKVVTIVRQMAVEIDRETGEKFPEPYIAILKVDGKHVHTLTRTTKIQTCRQITKEKYA